MIDFKLDPKSGVPFYRQIIDLIRYGIDACLLINDFEAQGMELAQLSTTAMGTEFAFIDASRTLGHMIELYEGSDGLKGFYSMVADAAVQWDGKDLIRELEI